MTTTERIIPEGFNTRKIGDVVTIQTFMLKKDTEIIAAGTLEKYVGVLQGYKYEKAKGFSFTLKGVGTISVNPNRYVEII